MDIDFNNYLTEEQKVEIAIDLFKEELRKGFLDCYPQKRLDNYERVIGNSVHFYLEEHIDSLLGTDFKKLLEVKVKEVLAKDITYSVFRKGHFDSKPSVAQQMLDSIVLENRGIAENKVKRSLENIELSDYDVVEIIKEIILNKFK